MSAEIRLIEGESIRVNDQYREVYERLLAAGWQNPVGSSNTTVRAGAQSPSTRVTSSTYGRGRRAVSDRFNVPHQSAAQESAELAAATRTLSVNQAPLGLYTSRAGTRAVAQIRDGRPRRSD